MPLKPLVFVPGLPGSVIRDVTDDVELFPSLASLTSTTMRPRLLERLSGPDDPNAADGVEPGEPVRSVKRLLVLGALIDLSGLTKQAETLYEILRDLGYSTRAPFRDRFRPVGWDWRRPVDQARVQRDVTAAIEDLHRTTGERVTVIAHSTGGLVMRSLLEGPQGGTPRLELVDKIERLIAIGIPWAGTLQSLSPLAALSGFGPLTAAETQRVLGRSWAAFDLLPPDPARTDMTDAEGDLNLFVENGRQGSPLVSTGWIPAGGQFNALRQRAARSNERFGMRPKRLSLGDRSLEVVNFVGWGAETRSRFTLEAGGRLAETLTKDGDGTIPRRSAAWLQGVTTLMVPLGHTPRSQILRRHITLWQSPAVSDLLGVLLAGRPRTPYIHAAVDSDDAVNVHKETVEVRGVALDPTGRALPQATMEAGEQTLAFGADGRGSLMLPRAQIRQRVRERLFRFEVRFRWQGPGGQNAPPQVLHVQK